MDCKDCKHEPEAKELTAGQKWAGGIGNCQFSRGGIISPCDGMRCDKCREIQAITIDTYLAEQQPKPESEPESAFLKAYKEHCFKHIRFDRHSPSDTQKRLMYIAALEEAKKSMAKIHPSNKWILRGLEADIDALIADAKKAGA